MFTIIVLLVLCVLVAYLIFREVSEKPTIETYGDFTSTKYNDGRIVLDLQFPLATVQGAGNNSVFRISNLFPEPLTSLLDAKVQVLSLTTEAENYEVKNLWFTPGASNSINGFGVHLETPTGTSDISLQCLVTARFTGTWKASTSLAGSGISSVLQQSQ